jgi:hypothetical protein
MLSRCDLRIRKLHGLKIPSVAYKLARDDVHIYRDMDPFIY